MLLFSIALHISAIAMTLVDPPLWRWMLGAILAKKPEEPKQSFGGPVWSDPEKSLTTFVDLINKSLVFMTSVPLNFIDPNGLNAV